MNDWHFAHLGAGLRAARESSSRSPTIGKTITAEASKIEPAFCSRRLPQRGRCGPRDLPVFVRISSTDWVETGWTLEDSIALCRILKAKGNVDLIDCSTGGPCRAGENFARRSGMAAESSGSTEGYYCQVACAV